MFQLDRRPDFKVYKLESRRQSLWSEQRRESINGHYLEWNGMLGEREAVEAERGQVTRWWWFGTAPIWPEEQQFRNDEGLARNDDDRGGQRRRNNDTAASRCSSCAPWWRLSKRNSAPRMREPTVANLRTIRRIAKKKRGGREWEREGGVGYPRPKWGPRRPFRDGAEVAGLRLSTRSLHCLTVFEEIYKQCCGFIIWQK